MNYTFFITKVKEHFFVVALSILFLVSFFVGFQKVSQPMIAEGDAYSRALIAKEHITFDTPLINLTGPMVWLPLHFTIIQSSSLFFSGIDAYYAQKIITYTISLLGLFPLYYYSKTISKNTLVGLLSALLYIIFPLRYYLSYQTLSEPIFITFILCFLALILAKKITSTHYVLASLIFFIASLVRYEAWLMLPVVLLWIVLHNHSPKRKSFIFFLSLLIGPFLWIGQSIFTSGEGLSNWYGFFKLKIDMANIQPKKEYGDIFLSTKAWEEKVLEIIPLSYLILYGTLLLEKLRKTISKKIIFYLLPLYFYLLLIIQVFAGTMEWFPYRYVLLPTILAIPMISESIVILISHLFKKKQNTPAFMHLLTKSIIVLMLVSIPIQLVNIKRDSQRAIEHNAFASINSTKWHYETASMHESFWEVVDFIRQQEISTQFSQIVYVYPDSGRRWTDQALFYFSGINGIDISLETLSEQKLHDEALLVTEQNGEKYNLPDTLKKIFENNLYVLYITKS